MFDSFPIPANLFVFAGLAGIVCIAGARLSYIIDAIAEKTDLARALLGLILLATATGLPELVTTVTAASAGNGDLALNNMFGGMLMQVAVLAVADMFVHGRNLTSCVRKPTVVVAGLLSITTLSTVLTVKLLGDTAMVAHVGLGSVAASLLYVLAMIILRRVQHHGSWSPVDLPGIADNGNGDVGGRENRYDDIRLIRLVTYALIAALLILSCGVLVVRLADTLAAQTGLGTSFVGASLLALTTSMPELSTTIAAVRVKAYTMAISNIFGSNLIMTFLLLPVDLAYGDGPVMGAINAPATFAVTAGIVITSVYCISLMVRPKTRFLGMGLDSMLIVVLYMASMGVLFILR